MPISLPHRALGLAIAAAASISGVSLDAIAKEAPHKGKRQEQAQSSEGAVIVVRIWKDGDSCAGGTARIRPVKGGKIDMSRFVEIGYVTMLDGKPQLQAMGEFFAKAMVLDITGMTADMNKQLKDRFVPISPGAYVLTAINCPEGNRKSWMGSDRTNLFAAESGAAYPIKGANVIDVRPGEILDAGILEIRSDDVGFFETKTASVVASPAPEADQAQLREIFANAGKKLRFATFRAGM